MMLYYWSLVTCICLYVLSVQGLGLLTNLIESSAGNRSQLIALKSMPPFDHPYPMVENTVDSLEALGMVR